MVLGDLDSYMQKNETGSPTYTIHKNELKMDKRPWLVWLSGLSDSLGTKGSLVGLPVRAHAWVEGRVPSRGHSM